MQASRSRRPEAGFTILEGLIAAAVLGFGLLTLRYGRLLREAELHWCDEALERLEKWDDGGQVSRTGERRG